MMALRVTPPAEEEGVEVERMVRAGEFVVSVYGCFDRSWASLHRTEVALMAPMTI